MASYYSMPRKSLVSTKSGTAGLVPANSMYQSSATSPNRISTISYRKPVVAKRNGLDDDDDNGPKNFALQTCKDTGVGDCPACLGTRTNCHQNECQLCCEVKVCGPSFNNCPFNPEVETQTDPACELLDMPCKCTDVCGGETCIISDRCGATGFECRCSDRSCNTSRHCIIVDNEDVCSFTDVECKCIDEGCALSKSCFVIDEDEYCEGAFEEYAGHNESTYGAEYGKATTALSQSGQLYDPAEIIRRCHNLCRSNSNYPGSSGAARGTGSAPPKCKIPKPCPKKKPCGDYKTKRERKRSPSGDFSSGNETDHYSIILEDEEEALKMPPSSGGGNKNQMQKIDTGVRTLSTSSVSRQVGTSSTRSANVKCSRSGVSVDSDRYRAQPRSRSQSKCNQKPLKLMCIQECQRRSPYCPNPASCKICRPNY